MFVAVRHVGDGFFKHFSVLACRSVPGMVISIPQIAEKVFKGVDKSGSVSGSKSMFNTGLSEQADGNRAALPVRWKWLTLQMNF